MMEFFKIFDAFPSSVVAGITFACLLLLAGYIVLYFRHRKMNRETEKRASELGKSGQALHMKLTDAEYINTRDIQ